MGDAYASWASVNEGIGRDALHVLAHKGWHNSGIYAALFSLERSSAHAQFTCAVAVLTLNVLLMHSRCTQHVKTIEAKPRQPVDTDSIHQRKSYTFLCLKVFAI